MLVDDGMEMATPPSKIQRTSSSTPGGPKFQEERILVPVARIRPSSPREQAMHDPVVRECSNPNMVFTRILIKNVL